MHAATHAAMAAARCVLAHERRWFRDQKYLAADLARSESAPSELLAAWAALLDKPSPEAASRVIAVLDDWLGQPLTPDEALSTFIHDNELSWLHRGVPPELWWTPTCRKYDGGHVGRCG